MKPGTFNFWVDRDTKPDAFDPGMRCRWGEFIFEGEKCVICSDDPTLAATLRMGSEKPIRLFRIPFGLTLARRHHDRMKQGRDESVSGCEADRESARGCEPAFRLAHRRTDATARGKESRLDTKMAVIHCSAQPHVWSDGGLQKSVAPSAWLFLWGRAL
jgi:hypothetical protein